jgi:lipopolysaccharide transport system permease protein
MLLIYTVVFSRLMRGSGLPDYGSATYTVFLCSGLLGWQLFSELLTRITGLFSNYGNLLRRTTVPWPALLASEILVSLVSFVILACVFAVFLAILDFTPGLRISFALIALSLVMTFAIALGLCLSVLQVFFRDVGLALPVILQIWFWATPIVYPMSALPDGAKSLMIANPLSAPIQELQHIFMPALPGGSLPRLIGLAALAVILAWFGYRMIQRNWNAMQDEF